MEKCFNVYKGLQKPLVFKGFKGRYIFWAATTLVLSLIIGIFISRLISSLVGALIATTCLLGSWTLIRKRQKRGLYAKTNKKGIFIYPVKSKL